MPILWHVIRLYAAQGFTRFLLATGYRGELIEAFASGHDWPPGVERDMCGHWTRHAHRRACQAAGAAICGAGRFCLTYADGLADIDLGALLEFHDLHGVLATMTVVRPELQFGVTKLDGETGACSASMRSRAPSTGSTEGSSAWRRVCSTTCELDSVLERGPLEGLAPKGSCTRIATSGFWECMDTYKDAVALNDLWASGEASWSHGGRASLQPIRPSEHRAGEASEPAAQNPSS